MKIPIFISPSQQPENLCKYGDNEQSHCRLIGNELLNYFQKDNRFVASISSIVNGTVQQKCWSVVYQSNDFINSNGGNISGNPSYHIAIHTNAGGGSGCAGFYTGTGKGKIATRKVLDKLNSISPWPQNDFKAWSGLIEMNTIASTVYLECNFHDNITQATWIHNNTKNIARKIYEGICETEGIVAMEEEKVVVNEVEQWKKDLVQGCIDLGVLEDKAWVEKANDSIPVYAVAKMILVLYKKCLTENLESTIKKVLNDSLINKSITIDTVTKK